MFYVFDCLSFEKPFSFEKQSPYELPFDSDRNYTPEPDFIVKNKNSSILPV